MDKKDEKINEQHIQASEQRKLPPEALRALQEAEERRNYKINVSAPLESGGRGGQDPARYGDWEIKGRAIDF